MLSEKQPKFIHTQIVPLQTCLLSSSNFQALVTERTFCAGGTTGEGPCNGKTNNPIFVIYLSFYISLIFLGDSGGGFVFMMNGRWLLRGLVSVGINDPLTSSCDPNFYVVFTDVAKFTPWMMNYISN